MIMWGEEGKGCLIPPVEEVWDDGHEQRHPVNGRRALPELVDEQQWPGPAGP